VRELVDSLNGKIDLQSQLDEGTTVTMTFPVSAPN